MKGFGDQHKAKKESYKKIKVYREKIFKQAFKLHSQGNISEASKYYQLMINQKFKDHRVFSNYGIILKNNGKLEEAELSYRKAIEIKPNFAEAHSNLGNILRDVGKLQEAELCTHKAIEIKPDFAEAHSNLGNILRDVGKLQEAELCARKAIEIKPDFAEAHSNLGNILSDLGKHQEALDFYLKAIDINPKNSNSYTLITRFLRDSDPSKFSTETLKNIFNLLLERNDIPHKELISVFNFIYRNEIINYLEIIDSNFSKIGVISNNKAIINALKKIIFCDAKLEEVLTKTRRNICLRIAKNTETISETELQFIIALGEQCFLNEYVYSLTDEENASLNKIIDRCKDIQLNEINFSILSCYYPLYKLLDKIASIKTFKSSNQSFKELIQMQIIEPLKEIKISKTIKRIGQINDNISQKVKSQYEENPYPRWRYGNHSENQKITIIQGINNEINPNYVSQYVNDKKLKILIAGCGTGNQILQAQRYRNAQITAIDICLSSLSYAQRKVNELGIKNIELIQMDILNVNLLEDKFDVIECGGVLHHMKDPSKGLKELLDILKPNGFLKLGLYSELARREIIQAREYITNHKIQANDKDIKRFRKDVFSGKIEQISNLRNWGNFYTMSECRDLCFHTQEHRFTINEIGELLKSNQLEFLGFLLQQPVKSIYKNYFPGDKKQINLQNWEKFEEQHPTTFASMYQFWVCKTKI